MNAQRYRYEDLLDFSVRLLERAGLPAERARVVGSLFVEADLLGYSTHGMQRLPTNVEWLLKGETRKDGDHRVVAFTPTCGCAAPSMSPVWPRIWSGRRSGV
ncbi:MAG: Ldh family oxidoreductase [Rhizobiales bacterium]|nr:Ldh family oxidoreductase [Hyphomicrobiales bacterium]